MQRLRLAVLVVALASAPASGAPIVNIDLSGNSTEWAAAVPDVAVDPTDATHIVAIWREIAMPDRKNRPFACHLAESRNGGATFAKRPLTWGILDDGICNAPYVDFGAKGELYIGATLVEMGPVNPPSGWHAFGRAVIRKSPDGGKTWLPTVSVIDSGSFAKGAFAPNPDIPDIAKQTPWDGARGIVNRSNGDVYVAGGYPAPPDGAAHSQRFYAVSHDGAAHFSPIYALGSTEYPQRWDSRIIAAPGAMALAYIAGAAPGEKECLCVVFATGNGADLKRTLVTKVGHMDTLVHYPPLAADPAHKGGFAIALVSDDRTKLRLLQSSDNGAHWNETAPVAAMADVTRVSRPAIAYASSGALVLLWRGQHADGSYDVYATGAADGLHFAAPVRITTQSSRSPEALKSDYAVRGDFINVMKSGPDAVHAVWTDWRTGTARITYARVPLEAVRK
jgi:hypothetical protein